MKRRKLYCLAAALGLGALILDSRTGFLAAAEGVDICIKTVIPALFPFFVLCILFTGSFSWGKWLLSLEKPFRSPGCGAILLAGLLGGYPVGAKTAQASCESGQVSRENANRMLMFCSQAGPAFLFGMVSAQFPGMRYTWMLWAVQLLSALCVAQCVQSVPCKEKIIQSKEQISLAGAMHQALRAMASVCGWVVLFRVVLTFLDRWVLWQLPNTASILFSGLLELTNGCLRLGQITYVPLRFLAAVVMLNFGGVCVMMQTASVAPGLSLASYIRGKLLQTLFALLLGLILLGQYGAILPISLIFFLHHKPIPRKNSRFPAAGIV